MATAVRSIPVVPATALNCKICPGCNRRLPIPKQTDKKLSEDIRRCESAIAILDDFIRTNRYGLGEACQMEAQRLQRALTDHGLLWSIYRRHEKTTGYGIAVVKKNSDLPRS